MFLLHFIQFHFTLIYFSSFYHPQLLSYLFNFSLLFKKNHSLSFLFYLLFPFFPFLFLPLIYVIIQYVFFTFQFLIIFHIIDLSLNEYDSFHFHPSFPKISIFLIIFFLFILSIPLSIHLEYALLIMHLILIISFSLSFFSFPLLSLIDLFIISLISISFPFPFSYDPPFDHTLPSNMMLNEHKLLPISFPNLISFFSLLINDPIHSSSFS